MGLGQRISHYLRASARYVNDPAQLRLRRRYFLAPVYEALGKPWVRDQGFKTILDIGAYVGGFSYTVGALFPEAMIYAFEPLADCYETMMRNVGSSPRFKGFNLALGERSAEAVFQRNPSTTSSSFLDLTAVLTDEFPEMAATEPVAVKVARLDDVAAGLKIDQPLLVKIDVQGYEDRVLAGGNATIGKASLVIVETSFEALYRGQPLFDSIYSTFADLGFRYAGSIDHLGHARDGRPLQEDSLFVRGTVHGPDSLR